MILQRNVSGLMRNNNKLQLLHCREYLPTFFLECGHSSPNVGKSSIDGASGYGRGKTSTDIIWCGIVFARWNVGK